MRALKAIDIIVTMCRHAEDVMDCARRGGFREDEDFEGSTLKDIVEAAEEEILLAALEEEEEE